MMLEYLKQTLKYLKTLQLVLDLEGNETSNLPNGILLCYDEKSPSGVNQGTLIEGERLSKADLLIKGACYVKK
jgi:hypothetical protein